MDTNNTEPKMSEPKDRVQIIDLVSWGQTKSVKELINILGPKLDINERSSYGSFAAIKAAERNDLKMLKLLVEHGARIDWEDGFGRTVRGWAERNNNQAMIDFVDSVLQTKTNQ
jgi:ankyrin repeat protein